MATTCFADPKAPCPEGVSTLSSPSPVSRYTQLVQRREASQRRRLEPRNNAETTVNAAADCDNDHAALGAQKEASFVRTAFFDAPDVSSLALETYAALTSCARGDPQEAQPSQCQCQPDALPPAASTVWAMVPKTPPMPRTGRRRLVLARLLPQWRETDTEEASVQQHSGTERTAQLPRDVDQAHLPPTVKPSYRHMPHISQTAVRSSSLASAPHAATEQGGGASKQAVALPLLRGSARCALARAPNRSQSVAQSEGSPSHTSDRSQEASADPMPASPTRRSLMSRALRAYSK